MKDNLTNEIAQIALDAVGVELTESENLKDSGLDSLALVSVVIAIEEKYGITFSFEDILPINLVKLSDLVRITESYL